MGRPEHSRDAAMAVPGCEVMNKHFKKFTIQRLLTDIGDDGLLVQKWQDVGTLFGILVSTRPDEQVNWQQLQHPVTHHVAQRGKSKAKPRDRLIWSGRCFYIQGVREGGVVHGWTIYQCEERADY